MIRPASFRLAATRLRQGWPAMIEATLAATVAWVLAVRVVGDPMPFFAPAAAMIVLGQARGQRMRRAVEVVLGVAAGVLVADLVVQALGPRTTWTVFTVILLTVGLATAVGASTIAVVQAAVSALYLVVIEPSTDALVPFRFVDALIGGGVALVASQLVSARDPLAPLVAEVRRTFDALTGLLAEITQALERLDETAARAALDRARRMDVEVERLRTAVLAAGEAVRVHLRRRRHAGRVQALDASVRQVDYAVRNVRVLARAGVTLTRSPGGPAEPPGGPAELPAEPADSVGAPAELAVALRLLTEAVRCAGEAFAADLTGQDEAADRYADQTQAAALDAVRTAGRLLLRERPLPLVMIVGQLRATAIDLLRGVGGDDVVVLSQVDEALGLPPV